VWTQRIDKLTESDRAKIAAFRTEGMTMLALAKRFGVSEGTISRVAKEKNAKPTTRGGFGRHIGACEL
jgi:IS30 family transposase